MFLALALALALDATAADLPPSLAAYQEAVAVITGAVQGSLPKLAACKAVGTEKLVFQVELSGVPKVTSAVLAGSTGAKASAPCQEKVVADVFTRMRPKVGLDAVVVLDVTSGAPRLDGDVALLGRLPAAEVEKGVRARMDAIAQCYVNALETAPGLTGEVVVGFSVLPSGHVLMTELKRTSLWNPETEACVLDEVRQARFAEPQGGALARVTYPFTFKPPEPAPADAKGPVATPPGK
jgi:TonB family protein